MGARLENGQLARLSAGLHLLEPGAELECEELSKHGPRAGARIKITLRANPVLFPLVVSINRTIESQAHEIGEGNSAASCYLVTDFIFDFPHELRMV